MVDRLRDEGNDVFAVRGSTPPGTFRHLVEPSSGDSHQTDPYWLAVIIPFAFRDTYDRAAQKSVSKPPVLELEKIIIDNDCVNWTCSSSKDSHVSNLSMSLLPNTIDYTGRAAPEDWILFWAFNDYTSYSRILELVKANKRSNDFNSGLKFVGKIQSVVKNKSVDPGTGRKSIQFSINSVGFTELDANMYFDQTIQILRPDASAYWSNFAEISNEFTGKPAGLIESEQAIPFLLSVCFGAGPSEGSKTAGLGNGRSISPNEAFLIPETILSLLMPENPAPFIKQIGFTYVDLLRVYLGTFRYTSSGFQPVLKSVKSFMAFGENPVSGLFPLQPLNFNNEPIWQIINTYLAQPMNESFTCLRAATDSRTANDLKNSYILPTLVMRQIPFSSPQFATQNTATPYLSLPRWIINDKLIIQTQYGYSNAFRYNFMHLQPINWANTDQAGKALATYLGEPIADSSDIKRAGLRAKIQTVNATYAPKGQHSEAKATQQFYNKLMADTMFGGHLKYTGTVTCKGIQDPICEGDNCEIDNIIFHIQRVSHSGSIDGVGKKEFTTSLQLTDGISVMSDRNDEFVYADNFTLAEDVGNTVERE